MKRRTLILLILLSFCLSINILAQDIAKIDSLWGVYKKVNQDTTKIKLLNEEIGYLYESINSDSAITCYKKAIEIVENNLNIKTPNLSNLKDVNFKKLIQYKANSLRYIGNMYSHKADYSLAIENYLESNKMLEELLKINSEIISGKKGIASSYNNIGLVYSYMGNYDQAIEYYLKSLKISEELSNSPDKSISMSSLYSMSSCYNNISILYISQVSYDKALDYNFKSLKINEQLDNKKGISECLNNIGMIYYLHTNSLLDKKSKNVNFEKALNCFFKALKIKEELDDKVGLAVCNGNIGVIYKEQGNYEKSLKYNLKNIILDEELGDKYGLAACYVNIGMLYIVLNDSTDLSENQKLNNFNKAIEYETKAIELAREIKSKPRENEAANSLMYAYKKIGNYKKSVEFAEIFIATKDSMFSEEKTKSLAEMGAKYETEKRELTIQKLEKEKELQNETIARKNAESKKQRILIFSFLIGFLIILVFSVFLYRLFLQKKKANLIIANKNQSLEIAFAEISQQKEEITSQRDEIEAQRDKVSEQNHVLFEQKKEITDSINYAKRIQTAVLPDLSPKSQNSNSKSQAPSSKSQDPESVIARNEAIPPLQSDCFVPRNDAQFETFILFRPKDIVSGDFYWFSKVNDYQIYAVSDCTGHGVPGAFMSMLGVSFLNEIVRKKEVTKASEVLDNLRNSIIEALSQTGEAGTQKDGMDMSLIAINITQTSDGLKTSDVYKAQWAGANNPLWLIRSSKEMPPFEKVASLEEMKPDKMPIAIYERMDSFTNHELQLYSGDTIYLMSDGYEDQFGGLKGKKFLSKNLKQLLLSNCQMQMEEQRNVLEKTLIEWIGEGEQIDDITLLGIRI